MILLCGLIYYILGGWVFLFYIIICILHELLFSTDSKKYLHVGLYMVVYFLNLYIALQYLFLITLDEAYFYIAPYELYYQPFMFRPNVLFYLFFLSLPMLQTSIFIYLKIKVKIKAPKKQLPKIYPILAQSVFILLAGIFILKFSFDQQEKRKIQVDYLAEQGQWEELLQVAHKINKYDRLVNFNVNRALYYTGQLLENMFNYNQMVGTDGLFTTKIIASQISIPASDLYFDLGHVQASQVMAYEGQTKYKYNPRILKRLVLTNIINTQYKVANKFLKLLNKSILHKQWVKHYETYLNNEALVNSDPLIQLKRMQKPKFDFFITNRTPNQDLIKLLDENENNKMAFEYLMAFYLLDRRLGNLAQYLDKFKSSSGREIPRHIQEVMLLIKVMDPSKINMKEYRFNPHIVEQFRRFHMILAQYSQDEVKAREILKKDFLNTYWYYLRYINPEKTHIKLKADKINEDIL
jgi:hypothetical protein